MIHIDCSECMQHVIDVAPGAAIIWELSWHDFYFCSQQCFLIFLIRYFQRSGGK